MNYHLFAYKPSSTWYGGYGAREEYNHDYMARINLDWNDLADALAEIEYTNQTLQVNEDGFEKLHIFFGGKLIVTSPKELAEAAEDSELGLLRETAKTRAKMKLDHEKHIKEIEEAAEKAKRAAEKAKRAAKQLKREREQYEVLKAKFDKPV